MERSTDGSAQVSTLFSLSLLSVIKRLPCFLSQLNCLPINVKERLLRLMAKRGLLTDTNIAMLVQSRTKVLDLSESQVTDQALQRLTVCRNLRKIDLNSVKGEREEITTAGIQALAGSCPLLSVVYLRRCVNIDDVAVATLAQSCRHLTELNLGGCPRLTDASLFAIGKNCQSLRSLNVSRTQVTDEGVFSLCNGACSQALAELHLGHCSRLTDEAVEGLVSCCPQLAILIFHGCPGITDRSRQALEMMQGSRTKMKQVTWTIY